MKPAARRTAFRIQLGDAIASSTPGESTRQLLQLQVELDMDGPVAHCIIELAEGTPPATGDAVEVKLDAGSGPTAVFTGKVAAIEAGTVGLRVLAHGAFTRLGQTEVEGSYENVSADFIIKDLIGKAGATAGTLAKGPTLAFWTLHRGPTALGHLRSLAALCGAGLFADGKGAIHCTTPQPGGTEHRFAFGETVIELAIRQCPPAFDSVEVWGEGAASAKGADRAHWLSTELSGVSAKACITPDGQVQPGKLGERPLRLRDGALRSGEAVEAVAKAWASEVAARLLRGSMEVFATPAILPGDRVEITGLPDEHPAAALLGDGQQLHVRGVRHRLDRQRGALTRLSF